MRKSKTVMRRCISCRAILDRKSLLELTNDHQKGILINSGMGRSAYICKTKSCTGDSKIKKKLQKALKRSIGTTFYKIFEMEIENYN